MDELKARKRLFWITLALGIAIGILIGFVIGIHVADTVTVIPLDQGIKT